MSKSLIEQMRYAGAPADSKLGEYGLEMPAPYFRGVPMTRTATNIYTSANVYSREQLIGMVETEHGGFGDGVDKEKLEFWRACISNSSLDSWMTKMARNSLTNYALDATSPTVAFQHSHSSEGYVGRSVAGQLVESGNLPQGANADDFFPAVIADFYSHRDLSLGSISVEQFILGIRTHVIKDVSIGFKSGEGFQYTCSVCKQNYFSWECRHITGVEYVVGDDGDPSDSPDAEKRMCFVWVENARLSEVSFVYDGATPNAMIIKAERERCAGRLDRNTQEFLEKRFSFRARENKQWNGAEFPPSASDQTKETENSNQRGEKMSANNQNGGAPSGENNATVVDLSPKIRAFARELGLEIADDVSVESVFETVRTNYSANKTKAGQFDTLRSTEIEIAIGEKVRAEGGKENFDEEKQKGVRSMLENCGIEAVKEFQGEWRAAGDKRFGAGRQSQDNPAGDKPNEGTHGGENRETDNANKGEQELPAMVRNLPPHLYTNRTGV